MQILQFFYYKHTFEKTLIPALKSWGYPYIVTFLNMKLNIIPYYSTHTIYEYNMYHDFTWSNNSCGRCSPSVVIVLTYNDPVAAVGLFYFIIFLIFSFNFFLPANVNFIPFWFRGTLQSRQRQLFTVRLNPISRCSTFRQSVWNNNFPPYVADIDVT